MRQALKEVVTDRRFLARKSVTPLEVAEHILQQAASGERDLNRLKSSAFEKLSNAAERCQPRWSVARHDPALHLTPSPKGGAVLLSL